MELKIVAVRRAISRSVSYGRSSLGRARLSRNDAIEPLMNTDFQSEPFPSSRIDRGHGSVILVLFGGVGISPLHPGPFGFIRGLLPAGFRLRNPASQADPARGLR